MNELAFARAGAFARFLSDRPPSVIVSDLANKFLSQPPGILNDYLRFEIFKALLEWHYARASFDQRLKICSEFGFPCVVQPKQLIERVSKSLNVPALAAVCVLGKCMRVTPEYAFDVFPVSERMSIPSNTKPIEEIPESLTVGVHNIPFAGLIGSMTSQVLLSRLSASIKTGKVNLFAWLRRDMKLKADTA